MIWCLGLYASGSTWLFNATMKVAASVSGTKPATGRYVTAASDLDFLDDPHVLPIVKSHDTDEPAAAALAHRAGALLLSIRDPRDCVTSLMLYQRFRFAAALDTVARSVEFCARFAAHPRAILLRYECGFLDKPATLDLIATALGGRLTDADRSRIFAETRRSEIERHIAGLSALPTAQFDSASRDIVDLATQWHSHHANRSGETGRWRHMLSLAEAAAIEHRLHARMLDFDYPMELAPYTRRVGSDPLRL
jgi:hypothetical protein